MVRRRGSNRRHDRPCYLTLHLSTTSLYAIVGIDCGSTNPANFPSCSSPFRSLNNIHFNFPSSAPHDCPDHDRTSHNDTDPLSFTVEATGIHGLTSTNSVAQGNSITIKNVHRNVLVNLPGLHGVSLNINFISGDRYHGAIYGGNVVEGTMSTSFAYRALLVLVRLVRPGPCLVGIPHSCKNKQNHREESVAGYSSDRPVLGHIEIRMQSHTPQSSFRTDE